MRQNANNCDLRRFIFKECNLLEIKENEFTPPPGDELGTSRTIAVILREILNFETF